MIVAGGMNGAATRTPPRRNHLYPPASVLCPPPLGLPPVLILTPCKSRKTRHLGHIIPGMRGERNRSSAVGLQWRGWSVGGPQLWVAL